MTTSSPAAEFLLTRNQLVDVALELGRRLQEGLAADGQEIACFPTYLGVGSANLSGEALVLDLGGTNLRAARVRVTAGQPELTAGPAGAQLPIRRGEPLPTETYLEIQTSALQAAAPEAGEALPLGYCFSYPAKAQLDGDAVLTRWTKGVDIPGVVGQPVGALLREHAASVGLQLPKVVVINDTVAALYASLALGPADGYIGLIVGTGTNMASFFSAHAVPKMPQELHKTFPTLPVNLESGNFKPPHMNRYDDLLDEQSENPGYQRFEKSVSGAYLGRLFALACASCPFDRERGAQGLVELLADANASVEHRELAQSILNRSADYVAASLAGLCAYLNGFGTLGTVRILAEGSLFWKAPGYASRVEHSLQSICEALGQKTRCIIAPLPHANLFGTAFAVLSKPQG